eukprot:TRINITY_DN3040_c0_g1_i1.p1 TRINITY_DN3040_c0_g1~~TRINITY_DN3040_c0_g1_i1.p1  ORF type:complete len:351 (+),score=40.62 TRINITY_DN3040_c0_g1_i1:85-1053(+)
MITELASNLESSIASHVAASNARFDNLESSISRMDHRLTLSLAKIEERVASMQTQLAGMQPHLAGTPLHLVESFASCSAVLVKHRDDVFVATCAHCVLVPVDRPTASYNLRNLAIRGGPSDLKGYCLQEISESVHLDRRYENADLDAALFRLKPQIADAVRGQALPLREAKINLGETVSGVGFTPLARNVAAAQEMLVYGRVCVIEGSVASIDSQSCPGISGAGAVMLVDNEPTVAGIFLGTKSLPLPPRRATLKCDVKSLGEAFGSAIVAEARAPQYVVLLSSEILIQLLETPSCTHPLDRPLELPGLQRDNLQAMIEQVS